MPLEDIPIIKADDEPLSGNAPVLLREIAEHVRSLVESGEATAIDLQALPLTPGDRTWLKTQLGQGEIAITLQAEGESTLNETNCPGVWWVTHHNEKGAVASEFIEITQVPELVKAHTEDIKIGLEHLEFLISDLS